MCLPLGISGSLIQHSLSFLYVCILDTSHYNILTLIGDTLETGTKNIGLYIILRTVQCAHF
jgi:hypothetical protein